MKKNTERLVYISIYVALAIVFDYIKEFIPFLNMPQGGSVNIALIPVVLASFHLGYKDGAITGLLWWLVSSLLGLNNYIISIGQYLCDYLFPSILPGFASLLYKEDKKYTMFISIIVVMLVRLLLLVISGAYYWPGDLAKGSLAAWIYSLSYNLPYNIATIIMLIIVIPIIYKRIKNIVVR